MNKEFFIEDINELLRKLRNTGELGSPIYENQKNTLCVRCGEEIRLSVDNLISPINSDFKIKNGVNAKFLSLKRIGIPTNIILVTTIGTICVVLLNILLYLNLS